MADIKRLSVLPEELRRKLITAFACMSILPLLFVLYIITTYVFPYAETIWLISVIILFAMITAFFGFYIMEEIIDSIIRLSRDARRIALRTAVEPESLAGKDEVTILRKSLSALATDLEKKALRVEKLEVVDKKVGVYKDGYIRDALEEELKRARFYRRPCAVVVVRFKSSPAIESILADEQNVFSALASMTSFLKRFSGEMGKIGRLGDSGLCMILPEYNRRQAVGISEEFRAGISGIDWGRLKSMSGWKPDLAVTVAAAPVDGFDVAHLLDKCLGSESAEG